MAPDEDRAQQLVALIQSETDYDVAMRSVSRGMLRKKDWSVTGSTKPTTAYLPALDQWVDRMATAGFEHECVFDGWGAMVPS